MKLFVPSRSTPSNPATQYSPFAEFEQQIDRLFNAPFALAGGRVIPQVPALELSETPDHLVVSVDLPGVRKEDVQVTLHDGVLSIGAERRQESETKETNVYRSERHYGRIERRLEVPNTVNPDGIKAAYKDGVLTVTLPKAEVAKPRQIEVGAA